VLSSLTAMEISVRLLPCVYVCVCVGVGGWWVGVSVCVCVWVTCVCVCGMGDVNVREDYIPLSARVMLQLEHPIHHSTKGRN